MGQAPFDPASEVRFDLGRGVVSLGARAPRLLIPPDALLTLVKHTSAEAALDFGRQLGVEMGRRVAERLDPPGSAGIAAVAEHLGGDLALAGLGSLQIERWGRALVLRLSGSPLGADGDSLVAAILEGALQRGLGRDTTVVPIERSEGAVRLVVVSSRAAGRVRGWLGEGVSYGEALARLNAG